ncbi:hypothetical protein TWF281_002326 [Arthrobotrys megalospora]
MDRSIAHRAKQRSATRLIPYRAHIHLIDSKSRIEAVRHSVALPTVGGALFVTRVKWLRLATAAKQNTRLATFLRRRRQPTTFNRLPHTASADRAASAIILTTHILPSTSRQKDELVV